MNVSKKMVTILLLLLVASASGDHAVNDDIQLHQQGDDGSIEKAQSFSTVCFLLLWAILLFQVAACIQDVQSNAAMRMKSAAASTAPAKKKDNPLSTSKVKQV